MSLMTRQPSGKPPWPITLIAGGEKAGKSYASAVASASDLIGRTFWIGVGEDDPDEYGAIPGARFEIVIHDGTFPSILASVRDAVAEPPTDGKPNLIVVDSGTRVWDMLGDEAQTRANARRKGGNRDQEATIGPDLWNLVTGKWYDVMTALRAHQGPSIITARLDVVTVMDASGKPTKEKTSKVKAQKYLPYDVGVVVEMPERGVTYITGVRSLKFDVQMSEKKPMENFTVDGLWRTLGLDVEGATAPRQHSEANGHASAVDGPPAPQQARQQPQTRRPQQQTQTVRPETAPDPSDAAAVAVDRYRNRPGNVEPEQPAASVNWAELFAQAHGNPEMLVQLRNHGRQAGLSQSYGMFGAIETELAQLAATQPESMATA